MEPNTDLYAVFYQRLTALRHDFHRIGKFDDANAKLDELCKLFVLKSIDQQFPLDCGRSRLSVGYLADVAAARLGDSSRLAGALHVVFDELRTRNKKSFVAFGHNPGLSIDPADDEFAQALLPVVESLPVGRTANGIWGFDVLNESFGHFIQDSFRHRKEDAQYLTPPEVVGAMIEIGLHDLLRDYHAAPLDRKLLVADPTCGVGSFLAGTYCHAGRLTLHDRPFADWLTFFGQDKVERMVRLTQVNTQLFTDSPATIRQGNSALPETLDDVTGAVDLLLTNPPFGASFDRRMLATQQVDARRFPILASIQQRQSLPARIDSEFLLFDRGLSLLRDGGRMLIVVPDKVVAAEGFAAAFRAATHNLADLLAIIDLPAETFAQAGTRTKTSIVYVRRRSGPSTADAPPVLMAMADDIGFRVSLRAGVSIKKQSDRNDLTAIAEIYRQAKLHEDAACIGTAAWETQSNAPSVSVVSRSALLNGRWNASFYRTDRLDALRKIQQLDGDQFSVHEIAQLVELDPDQDQRVDGQDGSAIISVLHVREDGFIDIDAVQSYAPTSVSIRCQPNDVLISRINPRIVRICVVPNLGRPVACSPEFAVLRCRKNVDPRMLALVLRSPLVQQQIQTLTSGTSASHNRIKSRELAAVQIPWPRPGQPIFAELASTARQYREILDSYYSAVRQTLVCFESVHDQFAAG